MNPRPVDRSVPGTARTLQIIVGTQVVGAVGAVLFALFIHSIGPEAHKGRASGSLATYICAGFAAVALAVRVALHRKLRIPSQRGHLPDPFHDSPIGQTQPTDALARATGEFATWTILLSALTEAATVFAGMTYAADRRPLALVTFCVMLLATAASFPTVKCVSRFVNRGVPESPSSFGAA